MSVRYGYKEIPRRNLAVHWVIETPVNTGINDPFFIKTACDREVKGTRAEFHVGYSGYDSIVTCKACAKQLGLV